MAKAKDISLSLVRTIKASPEKVFAAWTEPETLKQWMAPRDDMTVAVAETGLRPGGRYRIVMRESGGPNCVRPANRAPAWLCIGALTFPGVQPLFSLD